jgi:2-polyprenyl-6-hydroxyphenyl methylase/3-demethylubiquinone-9 3-methyltransferase
MVVDKGLLVIAIYHKTPFCCLWKIEKRIYTLLPRWIQTIICRIWEVIILLAVTCTGRNPFKFVKRRRGMSFHHDIHDWLGGYPYESATPQEIHDYFEKQGYKLEREFLCSPKLFGFFGTGCDEFVFRKL